MPRRSTALSETILAKEKALTRLRILQAAKLAGALVPRDEAAAAWSRVLGMIRDRMMALPDRVPELSAGQRETLRSEIRATLEACSRADLA